MVILQRGVPAHISEKDLRMSTPVSMSLAERERYAIEAQRRKMSLSAWLRLAADDFLKKSPPAVYPGSSLAEQEDEQARYQQEAGHG